VRTRSDKQEQNASLFEQKEKEFMRHKEAFSAENSKTAVTNARFVEGWRLKKKKKTSEKLGNPSVSLAELVLSCYVYLRLDVRSHIIESDKLLVFL